MSGVRQLHPATVPNHGRLEEHNDMPVVRLLLQGGKILVLRLVARRQRERPSPLILPPNPHTLHKSNASQTTLSSRISRPVDEDNQPSADDRDGHGAEFRADLHAAPARRHHDAKADFLPLLAARVQHELLQA